MTPRRTPALATWLLERFGSGPSREVLAGDLVEQYQQGRSRAWYWCQVVVAIVVSAFRDLRVHWVIAIRGLALGAGCLIVLTTFVAPLVWGPVIRFMLGRGLMMSMWRVHYYWDLTWAVQCVIGLMTGWLVGRAHRPHHIPTVLVCAVSLVLVFLPGLSRDTLNAVQDPAAWSFALAIHTTSCLVTVLSIVLGGLWSAPASDVPRPAAE